MADHYKPKGKGLEPPERPINLFDEPDEDEIVDTGGGKKRGMHLDLDRGSVHSSIKHRKKAIGEGRANPDYVPPKPVKSEYVASDSQFMNEYNKIEVEPDVRPSFRESLQMDDDDAHFNRRKQRDAVLVSIQVFAVIAWLVVMGVMIMIGLAKPPGTSFFTYLFNLDANTTIWNMQPIRTSLVLLISSILLCGIGLGMNSTRMKREGDRYSPSLIVVGILSVITLVVVLVAFGGRL